MTNEEKKIELEEYLKQGILDCQKHGLPHVEIGQVMAIALGKYNKKAQ